MVLKPIKTVKTIRDLIYWHYANLIARSAGIETYGFVVSRYKKLHSGDIQWSSLDRDFRKEWEQGMACVYCGSTTALSRDHIIPQARIGTNSVVKAIIDKSDNCVWACRHCNSAKGDRDAFEWYGKNKLDEIPKLVFSKFLKVAYELHEAQGTLDSSDINLDGVLDVYDLGAVLTNIISKLSTSYGNAI